MAEPILLTASELRMITTLRDMPESPLRTRVERLLEDLLAFARNPRCHELQADGVPCENPAADCDQCKVVLDMLEAMGKRLPRE
ncbi:hypothetical protein [Mesoterricola silvestris]|uniref:Uncharacterized protein n=1 Tax=Mesoterricola silvestris TaxID=2927979 RepID=A0AA48H0V8_9BACT|nr:hypothetical protein [Mesoterricola silvestris]BDU73978.1 hypothetical protein METEAL_31520 [Mesoterricola silvestris]